MNRRTCTGLMAAALAAAAAYPAAAQLKIDRYTINSGGGRVSGGGLVLEGSIGQSVAGLVSGGNFLHWIGFWAGEVPNPTVVNTISDLKQLPDGSFVSVGLKLSVSNTTDFGAGGTYGGFFYMEEADRTAGVRVEAPLSAVAGLARGSRVTVIGTLGTTPAGERKITGPLVIIGTVVSPPKPLGMRNSTVGGGDFGTPPNGQYGVTGAVGVNNVGLLVRTFGRVISVAGNIAEIDDGSGTPVRLDITALAVPPTVGSFIKVVGVSSLAKPGADRLRLVIPRNPADISAP